MSGVNNDVRISALLKGDTKTTRDLYKVLLPKVTIFVKANNGTSFDATEVFQEALFQIIKRAQSKGITLNTALDSYVFITCRNLWYQELNKRAKLLRNDGFFELEEKEDDPMETVLVQEQHVLFEEKFQELSENCVQLLKDYFGKMAYSDIVLKYKYASENTAFQRVFKCKKKMMELVKADPRYRDLMEL